MTVSAADLLDLEPVGPDSFRARHNLDSGIGAIFGGQPLGQALAAAARTIDGWPAHSLSALFLRGGVVATPVDYTVERTRDGRRYASRRIVARQGDRIIVDALASFHDPEEGPQHQYGDFAMPPAPETLIDIVDFMQANADRIPATTVDTYTKRFPIEIRLPDPDAVFFARASAPERTYWVRVPTASALTAPNAHQWALALLSDFWLASTAPAIHSAPGEPQRMMSVTLNHGIWFHGSVDPGDWLLYRTDSPWAGGGRGFQRGQIYDRTGRLIASTAQETTMRML
jgi:acyl-CoA thioesterase-2